MRPGSSASPSWAWRAGSAPLRSRMRGSALVPSAGTWSTTSTVAARSFGRAAASRVRGSTPPAEAPTTTMSCPGMGAPLLPAGMRARTRGYPRRRGQAVGGSAMKGVEGEVLVSLDREQTRSREALARAQSLRSRVLDAVTTSRSITDELVRRRAAVRAQLRALRRRRHRHASSDDIESLHRTYARTRNPQLRDRLLESYHGLARHLAARYSRSGQPRDDPEQVAALALLRALERFEPARGTRLSTYRSRVVEGDL